MTPAPSTGRILLVDDEKSIRLLLTTLLEPQGFEVMGVGSGGEALEALESFRPHVAIVDLQMPRMDGIETIQRLKERLPDIICVILTAHGSVQSAVQAMKAGAYDYLTKPFDNEQLLLVVRRALERALLSEQVQDLKTRLNVGDGVERILGDSPVMQDLRHQLLRIAGTEATVLIEGETGVGKELAARAIHFHSKRRAGPFVVVNCAAIPTHLAESEFFGHEKGAFTDATETRAGKFEQANGGTLFLDEVSELSPEIQGKLLRVLQERTVDRVGGTQSFIADVRVVAASNKPLESLIREGTFRQDLYHRLNVVRLSIPSLRKHLEDIPVYAGNVILRASTALGSNVRFISDEAIELLRGYSWPGNIRELDHVIQRAMVFAESETLEAGDIEEALPPVAVSPGKAECVGLDLQLRLSFEETERKLIIEALEKTAWNRKAAAKLLHIARRTLFNKIEKYSIANPNGVGDRRGAGER
jgi:DNA-binding NtrC family response regulator